MGGSRGFFHTVGRILLIMAAGLVITVALLYSAGTLNIYVHEKGPGGHRIWLPIPALAVPAALWIAPRRKLSEATRNVQPYLPAIRMATEDLARCPDAKLVEVEDATDHVLISKQGGRLVIDVDSSDATVHVSFPIRMAGAVASELSRPRGPI